MPDDYRTGGGLTGVPGLLAHLLQQRGTGEVLARMQLEAIWPEVVGRTLAQQSQPAEVSGGQLTIAVPSPTWNATLRTMERRILQTIQARCPELGIDRIRLVLGKPRPAATPAAATTRPSPKELDAVVLTGVIGREIDETVAVVADPELRERLAALMRRYHQLRQWRLAHGWEPAPTGELKPPAGA